MAEKLDPNDLVTLEELAIPPPEDRGPAAQASTGYHISESPPNPEPSHDITKPSYDGYPPE